MKFENIRYARNIMAAGVGIILAACYFLSSRSEKDIRNHVVKLVNERGSCSGEQIKAPSGMNYILTAAHCRVLEKDGSIEIITENGKHLMRKVIAEDDKSDLLLLEGVPNFEGLSIADYFHKGEHIRTFTHGMGFSTHKSEGELIMYYKVQIPLYQINDQQDEDSCNKPKNSVINLSFWGENLKFCLLQVIETATNAVVNPGSSGGPVVNDSGDLVGVVSAGDGRFGFLVTLQDIKSFLSSY